MFGLILRFNLRLYTSKNIDMEGFMFVQKRFCINAKIA